MKRTMVAILGMAMLAGCTTAEERMSSYRQKCSDTYGFEEGTSEYKHCIFSLDQAQQERAAAAARAAVMAGPHTYTPLPGGTVSAW